MVKPIKFRGIPFGRALLALLALAAMPLLVSCAAGMAKTKEASAIHYRLGVVHLNEGKLADALKELTTAIDIYPDDPTYHNALGLAYFARNMNEDAKTHLKKAATLDPDYSDAHLNLGAVYIVEKNWDKVIAQSDLALKNIFYRTPELAHNNKGWAYYNKGDYANALKSFRAAVAANKNYAVAHYNMGLTLSKLNSSREAADAFSSAVQKSPAYMEAHFGLGMELLKLKDRDGARKAFEKVVELAPKSDKAQSAREYINLMK